jgi:CubicO group peptidase (beta-lactamase class C family)
MVKRLNAHPVPRVPSAAVCLCLIWAITGCTATRFNPSGPAEILRRAIADRAFPGCTVVVGTDRRTLWSTALGFYDYSGRVRVRRDALYDLASVTKVAGTTPVFMRLVALGKVGLADPVGRYLPEFVTAASTPQERAERERITVEQLLTHTAGLVAWQPFYKTAQGYPDILQAIYATPLAAQPGDGFRYSDCGMILAGEVAARAGGRPLAWLEQELVFGPLGMRDSIRCPQQNRLLRIPPTEVDTETGRLVHGVVHDENARAAGGVTGHAGLFATAEDLGRLAAELLRATEGRSRLFPREVAEDFFRCRGTGADSGRAIGWGVASGEAGKPAEVVYHSGFTGTYIQLDLQRKWFVVLLTNRVHPSRDNGKIAAVRQEFLQAVSRQFAPASGLR